MNRNKKIPPAIDKPQQTTKPYLLLWTSGLIGLLTALFLYLAIAYGSEFFRILSFKNRSHFIVLAPQQANFYNLIFAFFSLIAGQSIAITFYTQQSKRISRKTKISIIHDQRFLFATSIPWLYMIILILFVFYYLTFYNGFQYFSFYPNYNFLWCLLLICLFLQSWNSLNLYQKRSQKWMFISFFVLSLLSYSFSKIPLLYQTSVSQIILNKNILQRQQIQLVTLHNPEQLNITKNQFDLFMVNDSLFTTFLESKQINFDSLETEITNLKKNHALSQPLICRAFLDKNISTDQLARLSRSLSTSDVAVLAIAVLQNQDFNNNQVYNNHVIRFKIPNKRFIGVNSTWLSTTQPDISKFDAVITFKNNRLLVNNQETNLNRLSSNIAQTLKNKDNNHILFSIQEPTKLSNMLTAYAIIRELMPLLRTQISQQIYNKDYNHLGTSERLIINQKVQFITHGF